MPWSHEDPKKTPARRGEAGNGRPTICMVVHAYFPLGEPRVQREARAAREAGFDVTVFALRGEDEPREEMVDGIRVRRAALDHRRGAGLARMVFEYLAFGELALFWLAWHSMRRPFAIVHFHNPPDFLIIAGLLPRAIGSKLILDIHDLSPHMFAIRVPGRGGMLASRVLTWVERLACAIAHEVITVHEPYRAELVKHGVPADKVRVVMNSADDAVLSRARKAAPFRGRSAPFRLAYHGTLTPWYGADLIVDAVAILRRSGLDVDAVIIGDGDQVASLREQVARLGLDGYVHLSGRYLPIETAIATAAAADCGVIPNRPSEINRFALSSKLFEYVAVGVPVVVSRLQTLSAYFSPDEVSFFEPDDAGSLAGAVRWVYEHPNEARARASRAALRAEEYSWSRGRRDLIHTYKRLVGEADDGLARSRPTAAATDSVVTP
jgi:glycosyltransferase involved in cell wall biosynthesis